MRCPDCGQLYSAGGHRHVCPAPKLGHETASGAALDAVLKLHGLQRRAGESDQALRERAFDEIRKGGR